MNAIHWMRAGAVTLLVAWCGACQPPAREFEEPREPTPGEACNAELSAFAQRLEDCGVGSVGEMMVFLEDSLPGRGCASVTAIRDVDALYDECIPSVEALSCGEVLEGVLPASCAGQLLHDPSAPCDDLLTVMAQRFAACGAGDAGQLKQDLESQLEGGSCEAVAAIRDEQELYNACIPTLEALSCEELLGPLPESCVGQLQTYTTTTTG